MSPGLTFHAALSHAWSKPRFRLHERQNQQHERVPFSLACCSIAASSQQTVMTLCDSQCCQLGMLRSTTDSHNISSVDIMVSSGTNRSSSSDKYHQTIIIRQSGMVACRWCCAVCSTEATPCYVMNTPTHTLWKLWLAPRAMWLSLFLWTNTA